jgi:o-succinylbenzoate synthase
VRPVVRIATSRVGIWRTVPTQPVGTARQRIARRDAVMLYLDDGEGHVGLGEASPLPGYSPDTLDVCLHHLMDIHLRLPTTLAGLDAASLAQASEGLEAVPSARFALETALLDLAGQRSGRPAYAFLTDRPAMAVAVSGLLPPLEHPDLLAAARILRTRGLLAVKAKVGALPWDVELAILSQVRTELGQNVALRLDANGAWSLAEARARLRDLSGLDIAWVEQPVQGLDLLALSSSPVPWAADEALADPMARNILAGASGCAALVLKPAVLGGFQPALDLAAVARRYRQAVVVTHLFDGPVALHAARSLAHAIACSASGLDVHPALGGWPKVAVPTPATWLVPTALPGLGLSAAARKVLSS